MIPHPADTKEPDDVPAEARPLWTVDRKVPVALILAICIQGAAAVWWASGVSRDVVEMQKADARFDVSLRETRSLIEKVDILRSAAEMRQVRIEEQIRQIYDTVKRLDDKLDRQETRSQPNRP